MSAEEQPKGPLTREEYERRHKNLQDKYDKVEAKYDTFSRRVYRILAVMVIGLLLTGGASAYLYNENGKRSDDITGSLVESCEQNGEPLRAAVRKFGGTLIDQTQRQIDQSKTFEESGTYAEIFPDFSPQKLHVLLVKGRKEDRKTKTELREAKDSVKPVNCEERFPGK